MRSGSWFVRIGEGVQDSHRVGLGHDRGCVDGRDASEGCRLVALAEQATCGGASEDEGHDVALHVLAYAIEWPRLDLQAGLLVDLSAQAVLDGLAVFEDAAGGGGSQWPLSRRWMMRALPSSSTMTPATLTE
jgi:hypothetical protein